MNLNSELAKNLYPGLDHYDCRLILQRFGYSFYKDAISPLGSVICFEAPTKIGTLVLDNALVICGELSNVSMFGGVCFHRLYLAQVGSLLGQAIQQECYVNENVLVVGLEQASINLTNKVKDSVLFHIIVPIKTTEKEFYQLNLKDTALNQLKESVVSSFYYLLGNVYKETQRDNF